MPHYFDADPLAPSDRKTITCRVNGINFEFVTDTNVFCRDEVDRGSMLLIEAAAEDIKAGGSRKDSKLLDLGCGWGAVGVIMKRLFMKFDVTSVDVNARAVALTKENYALNNVKPYECKVSDVLADIDEGEMFDYVITNPPVRAGKKTVFMFYEQAFSHMKEGSSIYVVLQRKQGAPSSEKKLNELFGNCETLEISGGYRVMKATKESAD
ncbi:MAG: class I SAM-dependent methyltransferase [Clostridiales bacterium]|nr:class I SAM-dependent methyltransferase [Clostridiales bacterium]